MELWKKLDYVSTFEHFDLDGEAIGFLPLLKSIMAQDSGHVSEFYKSGTVKQEASENEDPDKLISVFQKYSEYFINKGGRLIYRNIGDRSNAIFLWKAGLAEIDVAGNYLSIRCMSHDEAFVKEVGDYFDQQWAPAETLGHIYAIVQQGSYLSLSSIGNAGIPLVEENYTPGVMEDYKFVIRDLQSEHPSGRIVIMSGMPGTGKTHLIRAMLLEIPDAMFVLISPEIVTNLAGPQLLPLLISHRGNTTGPIVLVLEDADKCLVARDKDNMNSIQSLLNLGDGILGSMLDLRIVATTNAHQLHMEEALMRPGRLSKMLEVGALDLLTAQKIFQRLCPDKTLPVEISKNSKNFKMTLAEAYALARKHGWASETRKMNVTKNSTTEEEPWEN